MNTVLIFKLVNYILIKTKDTVTSINNILKLYRFTRSREFDTQGLSVSIFDALSI